jgi:hypothetical protein
MYVVLSLIR